jgi:hypothetical protein
MPTPLVNIRESQFARYCKQIGPGTWGVVDVSLDSLFPYPLVIFRRRPSGCLIVEMPDGYSKVSTCANWKSIPFCSLLELRLILYFHVLVFIKFCRLFGLSMWKWTINLSIECFGQLFYLVLHLALCVGLPASSDIVSQLGI